MIYVDRSRSEIPEALALNKEDSKAAKELKEAKQHYDPANWDGKTNYKFKAYKEARTALNELFAYKCAYCESKYAATAPVDVEHFRPKSHYWWLAATWENLLPSCIDCNRSGKGTKFPLEDETRRAAAPGGESNEQTLLLNPCEDLKPEEHLAFSEDGSVLAQTPRGEASIEVYKLWRQGLKVERHARLKIVQARIKQIRRYIRRLDENPDDAEINEWLRDAIDELNVYLSDDQPYAAMARQFARQLKDSV